MDNKLEKIKFKKILLESLKKHKFRKDDNIFVASNLSHFGKIKLNKKTKLDILFDTIKNDIIPNGTIFVPTATMNLCNTSKTFDINKTPSFEMGAFSEYVRLKKRSVRSLHPYWSVTGIGKKSNLLKTVSKHSYGLGSPWSKFLDLNVKQLNIGIHPSRAVTLIHHIETCIGVPYRYNKEFTHKIKLNNKIKKDNFYMSVFYTNSDIQKKIKLNEHYFKKLKDNKLLESSKFYKVYFWSFKMKDFYDIAINYFIKDIYNYLEKKPNYRPYNI